MASSTFALMFLSSIWNLSALNISDNPEIQEQLLLKTLGLSDRPRPSTHGAVPSLLWKIFKKAHAKDHTVSTTDPCMVSEFGVRGNIVRYVQDQGKPIHVVSAKLRSIGDILNYFKPGAPYKT